MKVRGKARGGMLFRSIVMALAPLYYMEEEEIWTLTMQESQHPDLSA